MKISLEWLNDFIDLKNINAEQICQILTSCGLETNKGENFNPVNNCGDLIIGEIVDCWQHPNADKLQCTLVDVGKEEKLNIVCGAPNARKGLKVIVAPVNATLISFSGERFKIKKSKIRGELSEGMLCAEDEIGLSDSHEKIIELNTSLPNGTSLKEIYKDQEIIEVDITPNRADACSHLGVARDLKAVKNLSLNYPQLYNFKDIKRNPKSIMLCDDCSRFSTVSVKNVKITDSPDWIKERLNAVGIRSINNIVDITNYVMLELGQPLHAYDLSYITEDQNIFIRKSQPGEMFLALNKGNYELTGNELVIADKEKILSLAGVMGGLNSGIKNDSNAILFESACFTPSMIRKTSKKLNLKSESSYRFERGTDPCITLNALKRVCFLLKQQQPEVIIENVSDSFLKEPEYKKIYFNYERVRKMIGVEIPNETMGDILTRLDIILENVTHDGFTALVPPYRVDVDREADLVEEILRIYGYDNIPCDKNFSLKVLDDQFSEVTNLNLIKNKISDVLAFRGFQEIFTNSLTSSENTGTDGVLLINSVSSKLNSMRTSMLPSMLEVVDYNFNHDQKFLKLFEIGKTYHQGQDKITEIEHCSCVIANRKQTDTYFFDLKNEIYNVFQSIGFVHLKENLVQDGVEIFIENEKVCYLKSISYEDYEVVFADIILNEIPQLKMSVYFEISKFPSVIRDLSLILDKSITYQDIKKVVEDFNSEFISDYKVVDIYDKELDKKTYTISFTLSSLKNTLNDKTIQNIMTKLIGEFENKIHAKILK